MKTTRDFCFWMRGVLDASQGAPSKDHWNLIVEHVNKLKSPANSNDPCSHIVMMIWGFIQVAGDQYPNENQWSMIIQKTYEYLDQVPADDQNKILKDFEDIAKKAEKEVKDKWQWPKPTPFPDGRGPHYGERHFLTKEEWNWPIGDVQAEDVGRLIAEQC